MAKKIIAQSETRTIIFDNQTKAAEKFCVYTKDIRTAINKGTALPDQNYGEMFYFDDLDEEENK